MLTDQVKDALTRYLTARQSLASARAAAAETATALKAAIVAAGITLPAALRVDSKVFAVVNQGEQGGLSVQLVREES